MLPDNLPGLVTARYIPVRRFGAVGFAVFIMRHTTPGPILLGVTVA